MAEVIPERLIHFPQIAPFMAWLRELKVDPEDKKQILMYWCDYVGVKTKGDMLKWAGIK